MIPNNYFIINYVISWQYIDYLIQIYLLINKCYELQIYPMA